MAAHKPVTFPISEGADVTYCRSCRVSVAWIVTRSGKRMPVEAYGVKRGESHFANCRDAAGGKTS